MELSFVFCCGRGTRSKSGAENFLFIARCSFDAREFISAGQYPEYVSRSERIGMCLWTTGKHGTMLIASERVEEGEGQSND